MTSRNSYLSLEGLVGRRGECGQKPDFCIQLLMYEFKASGFVFLQERNIISKVYCVLGSGLEHSTVLMLIAYVSISKQSDRKQKRPNATVFLFNPYPILAVEKHPVKFRNNVIQLAAV